MASDMYGFVDDTYRQQFFVVFDEKHEERGIPNTRPYLVVDNENCTVVDWHETLVSARGQVVMLNAR